MAAEVDEVDGDGVAEGDQENSGQDDEAPSEEKGFVPFALMFSEPSSDYEEPRKYC